MSALHTRNPGISLGAMPDSSLAFAQNVVGKWRFDEGAGGTALDSGLYGNHGEFMGNAKRAVTPRGPALQIDGISGHVSVPHSPLLMPQRITVMVRTRNLAPPMPFDMIVVKANDSNWHEGYGIWYDSPTVAKFYVARYDTAFASVTVDPLVDNTLVGTYDGSAVRVFANGVEGVPMNYTGSISLSSSPLEFGRGRHDNYNINGFIHEVTILNVALPVEQARRLSAYLVSG